MYQDGAIDSEKIRMRLSVSRNPVIPLFLFDFLKNIMGVRHLTDVEHIEFRLK